MKTKPKLIILIHDLRSVHNVASIFRTADGAGVSGIILSGTTPGPRDRFDRPVKAFAKVSLGAEDSVPWKQTKSPMKFLEEMRKKGFDILCLEQAEKSTSIYKAEIKKDSVLVIGHEVRGVPKKFLEMADKIIEIPMRGKKESLNVSVATGIALYFLLK